MDNTYIQNFMKVRQQEQQRPAVKTDVVHTPERPTGYIVHENIAQSAANSVSSLAVTGKYFWNAINGKGTDYTIGRINDGAKFVGSLGIAAALASTAKNTKIKMMEFVGFATWFGSMSLWPKFIGTAVKATKGVDINQEYVDSYGRRKRFYEDAQYIPWDLYSKKELNKLGDDLGVPKNIENRSDAIKEKAKQVAVQSNTLMMITAGFATPAITALICNGLEKPVDKIVETYKLFNAKMKLNKLSAKSLIDNPKANDNLHNLLGAAENIEATPEQMKNISLAFNEFKSTTIGDGVFRELDNIMQAGNRVVKPSDHMNTLFANATKPGDDKLQEIFGNSPEIIEKVKTTLKQFSDKDIGDLVGKEVKLNVEATKAARKEVKLNVEAKKAAGIEKVKTTLKQFSDKDIGDLVGKEVKLNVEAKKAAGKDVLELDTKGVESFRKSIINSMSKQIADAKSNDKELRKIFAKGKDQQLLQAISEKIDATAEKHAVVKIPVQKLTELYKRSSDYIARRKVVAVYSNATVANVACSQTAHNWGSVPVKIVKALGFNREQLELMSSDYFSNPEYIIDHLQTVVKDKEKLDKAVDKIVSVSSKAIAREEKAASELNKHWEGVRTSKLMEVADCKNSDASKEVVRAWKTLFKVENPKERELLAKELAATISKKYDTTVDLVSGFSQAKFFNHAIELEKTAVKDKLINTQMSFYKPLLLLARIKEEANPNIIRELTTGLGIDFWSNKAQNYDITNKEQYLAFVHETLKPADSLFGEIPRGKALTEKQKFGSKMRAFFERQKFYLIHIDGTNRRLYDEDMGEKVKNIIAPWGDKLGGKLSDLKAAYYHEEKGSEEKAKILEEIQKLSSEIKKERKEIARNYKVNVDNLEMNSFDDIVTRDRSSWTERMGKTVSNLFRDAAKADGIKSRWFKRTLAIAVPLTAITLYTLSQFGKKNQFNPDVYTEKGQS